MTALILVVVSSLIQLSWGQQPQMVAQYLNPSQAASVSAPTDQSAPFGLLGGPAASLGQIFFNLLNYKLQWLNQLAGHLTGHPISLAKPGASSSGHPPGYPFMTTLVTTLSGNSPTVPGIHISGAPVSQVGTPGAYPGAATTLPPQDFHWIPVMGPGPQAPPSFLGVPQAPPTLPGAAPLPVPPGTQAPGAQPPVLKPPAPQVPVTVPVIPAVEDFAPIATIVTTPTPSQNATNATTTTTTTPKPAS